MKKKRKENAHPLPHVAPKGGSSGDERECKVVTNDMGAPTIAA